MRSWIIACVCLALTACNSGSPAEPSPVGAVADIAGSWSGTFASSNNPTEPIVVELSQNGSKVTGTWLGTEVSWTGQVTGSMNGSSFSGQMTFSGTTASEQVVCKGTANIDGSVKAAAISLSSVNGVVGGSCPAPLPAAIRIELHR